MSISLTTPTGRGPFLLIAYVSRRGSINDEQVIDMMLVANKMNWIHGVTGAIWFGESRFFQVIEGEPAVIRRLYGNIRRDPRHHDVRTLAESVQPIRRFNGWGMHVFEGDEQTAVEMLSREYATPATLPTQNEPATKRTLAPLFAHSARPVRMLPD
jgi:hypothetical protein